MAYIDKVKEDVGIARRARSRGRLTNKFVISPLVALPLFHLA